MPSGSLNPACLRMQLQVVGRQLLKADATDAGGRACGEGGGARVRRGAA